MADMERNELTLATADRRLSRRAAIGTIGGAGLAAGLISFAGAAAPVPAGGRALRRLQEGTPEGEMPPIATPVLGERADGSVVWHVVVGGMDLENGIDLQGFFPGEITINAGDAIWFDFHMPGFHTVSFASGGAVPPLLIPDPDAGTPAADAPPKLILNPEMIFPVGGETYDGTGYVNSGIDVFRDPMQPFVLTFSAPGTFEYLCIPHGAVMRATVVVQEASAARPHDQAAYDAMAAEQQAALVAEGLAEIETYGQATSTTRDDGTTLWEAAAGAGPGQARVMRFLPDPLEIKTGDTVKWVNRSPGEPHTVTFVGAGAEAPEDTLVEPQPDGSVKFVQNMLTFLPQGGAVFSGEGYVNSGFMGIPELGLPMEYELTFDTPGEYLYYCVLHGSNAGEGMAARVIVTAV